MWIDINQGFISESTIEYIERVGDGSTTTIRLNLISGRTVEVTGELARRILEYADRNKVQFVDRLDNPVGLNSVSI